MRINELKLKSEIRLAIIRHFEATGEKLTITEFFKLHSLNLPRLYTSLKKGIL